MYYLHKLVVLTVLVVGLGLVGLTLPTTSAQAMSRTTPQTLRGTWYHWDKRTGYDKRIIRKHQIFYNRMGRHGKWVKNLEVIKVAAKGNYTQYGFMSHTTGGETGLFFSYHMRINGKQQHVMVESPQGASMKPRVYTHAKLRHDYRAPQSVKKHLRV